MKSERIKFALEYVKVRLPFLGVLAFSLCSIASVYYLLEVHAKHPHPALWFAAALVEVTTAWLVMQIVGIFRQITKSKITKQDRRFYSGLLCAFCLLCIPSLGLSVWANTVEFDTYWLGMIFPVLSVACAVGAAIPGVLDNWEQEKAKKTAKSEADRAEREAKKAAELQLEVEAAQALAEKEQVLESLGQVTRRVLEELEASPGRTHASIAEQLGIERQSVSYHVNKLAGLGLIERSSDVVEVLTMAKSSNGAGK